MITRLVSPETGSLSSTGNGIANVTLVKIASAPENRSG